jgi:hypothetical protein
MHKYTIKLQNENQPPYVLVSQNLKKSIMDMFDRRLILHSPPIDSISI